MQITKEQMATIQLVAQRLARKYSFGYFDEDDIKQEAFIMAMGAMDKYDQSRPLENFLMIHIGNRLKNLKRDKYYRSDTSPEINNVKKGLMDTIDIFETDLVEEPDLAQKLTTQEAVNKVLAQLDFKLRSDFFRLANGVTLPLNRKKVLVAKLEEILGADFNVE